MTADAAEAPDRVLARLAQGKAPAILATRFDSEAGEDLFARDRLVAALERAVLGPEPDVFGRTLFDAPSITLSDVIAAAREVSLLSPRRLVLVRGSRLAPGGESGAEEDTAAGGEAESPEASRTDRGGDAAQIAVLERYLEGAADGACIAFIGCPWDARRKIHKAVLERALVVDTSRPDLREIPGWIENRVRELGLSIEPDAAALLCELVGNDTLRLAAEIDKLRLHAAAAGDTGKKGAASPPRPGRLTAEAVRALVGGGTQASAWVLVDALADGDATLALGTLRRLIASGEPAPMIVGAIAARLRQMIVVRDEAAARRPNEAARRIVFPGRSVYFADALARKVSRYSPKALIEALVSLYDVDRASKSGSVDPGALLETWLIATLKTPDSVRS